MKQLHLIEAHCVLNGMYDILNNCLKPNTVAYNKAMELIDRQWQKIEELKESE